MVLKAVARALPLARLLHHVLSSLPHLEGHLWQLQAAGAAAGAELAEPQVHLLAHRCCALQRCVALFRRLVMGWQQR